MSDQLKEVQHDYIRYANCWEDADVLLEGLQIQSGDKVLSIGSAGDNSFSLLVTDPESVVAVDINPIQLNLIELKKGAFLSLDHDQFLQFLGFKHSDDRVKTYKQVKEHLTDEIKLFWDNRLDQIEPGIIYQGKFEKYFMLFNSKILPLIHTKKRISELFKSKDKQAHEDYYKNSWNNWRWRLLIKIFFSKRVMGKVGRDPAFLKEVKVSVGDFIFGEAEKHLKSVECQQNYYLEFILTGKFQTHLPHYARQENYEKIKSNVNRLTVFKGLAEDTFEAYSGFNKFNLSNIFEYMTPELFQSVAENLVENGKSGSRYVYWNLMVPRRMGDIISQLENDKALTQQLTEKDKCFFYANVNVDVKK